MHTSGGESWYKLDAKNSGENLIDFSGWLLLLSYLDSDLRRARDFRNEIKLSEEREFKQFT